MIYQARSYIHIKLYISTAKFTKQLQYNILCNRSSTEVEALATLQKQMH